jgi:hypothetical protein
MDRFAGAERDAAGLAEAAQRLDHLGGERDGDPPQPPVACTTRVDEDQQQSVERIPARVDEWSPQVRSYQSRE